jgi:hypothetical protein
MLRGISADLAETAQQRQFAFEPRRCQRAAAARISAGIVGQKGRTSMTAGLFNMPGWYDSYFGSPKENNPSLGATLRSTCRVNGACMVALTGSLLSPASALWPPRGLGGGSALLRSLI